MHSSGATRVSIQTVTHYAALEVDLANVNLINILLVLANMTFNLSLLMQVPMTAVCIA